MYTFTHVGIIKLLFNNWTKTNKNIFMSVCVYDYHQNLE